jgi:hypothetical protein
MINFVIRLAVSFALISSFLSGIVASAQDRTSNNTDAILTVRISAEKQRLKPGENVVLHVEILNEGSKNTFVSKGIQGADNALSTLDLSLYQNGHVFLSSTGSAADCFCSGLANSPSAPPMASVLSAGWIALAPKHFYGGEAIMSPWDFKLLRVPGKYRIQGKYASRGFLAQDMNNPLLGYSEELKKLPYQSWIGEVKTNSVWIEVASPADKKQ